MYLELVGADITQRWIYVRDYNVGSTSGLEPASCRVYGELIVFAL